MMARVKSTTHFVGAAAGSSDEGHGSEGLAERMVFVLRGPSNLPRTSALVDADQASDRTRVSPLSKVVPSCKTSDEGVDGHDIDEGPMHKVELQGGFLAASFPHPQHLASLYVQVVKHAPTEGGGAEAVATVSTSTLTHFRGVC
jgi:hypothetical protein